jgi:hypothetical protein
MRRREIKKGSPLAMRHAKYIEPGSRWVFVVRIFLRLRLNHGLVFSRIRHLPQDAIVDLASNLEANVG